VAVASKNRKLIGTPCFDQALNQAWYNKLSLANHAAINKPWQLVSVLSLGLLAPVLIEYRVADDEPSDVGQRVCVVISTRVSLISREEMSRRESDVFDVPH
jgi:hypothetical protein